MPTRTPRPNGGRSGAGGNARGRARGAGRPATAPVRLVRQEHPGDEFESELVDRVRAELDFEPPPTAQSPSRRPRLGSRPRTLRRVRTPWSGRDLVTMAVLVLALGALAWGAARWWDARSLDSAHQAALAAARQTTVDFVTISASSVDSDLQRIADSAAGDFKDEFTRGMPQVRQAVVENKVESTGQVLRAALVSGDLDSAVVLVAIDASVHNVAAPDGRLSHYRIQVDLALDPQTDRWLVNRLQFVG